MAVRRRRKGGGTPPTWTPPPSPQTEGTVVRKNEIYDRKNPVGPFLGHTLLGPRPRDLLEREGGCGGNSPAATERLQGTAKAVGGRLLAVGDAVGAGVGVWECLLGQGQGPSVWREGVPPPPFQTIPCPDPPFPLLILLWSTLRPRSWMQDREDQDAASQAEMEWYRAHVDALKLSNHEMRVLRGAAAVVGLRRASRRHSTGSALESGESRRVHLCH